MRNVQIAQVLYYRSSKQQILLCMFAHGSKPVSVAQLVSHLPGVGRDEGSTLGWVMVVFFSFFFQLAGT